MWESPWASASFGHPPQGQHSLGITVHQQNTPFFINLDIDGSCDTLILRYSWFFSPPRRSKTLHWGSSHMGRTCKILSGMQYHTTATGGRQGVPVKKACQHMTMGVYIRTQIVNINHVFHSQGTPCLEHNILMSSMLGGWWFSTWLNGPQTH